MRLYHICRDPVSTGGEEVVTSSPTATQSEQSEGKSVTSPCDDEEKTDDRDAIHSVCFILFFSWLNLHHSWCPLLHLFWGWKIKHKAVDYVCI